MVSILPAERTSLDVIGKLIGQNVSQNLPGAVNKGYERQTGMNALDRAEKEIAAAGGDPMKIAMAFARAGAQNANLERVLGPIYQTAIQQAGAKGQGEGLSKDYGLGGGGGTNTQPLPNFMDRPDNQNIQPIEKSVQSNISPIPEGKKTSNDIDTSANQYLAQIRPDLVNPSSQYGAIATFDSEIKRDLTPQEEGQIRQQLLKEGKAPAVIDKVVDRLREGIQNKYQEAQDKYGFDKERILQNKEKWNAFAKNAPTRLKGTFEKFRPDGKNIFPKTEDLLLNKYFQYAGKLPTSLTPEQMHTNAMASLQNDINRLDALAAIPAMAPYRTASGVKEYFDINKDAYKALANEGFEEALKEDAINNKDMGNEEFHSILWGDQTNKQLLNQLHEYKPPVEYPVHPYLHYNQNYKKERQKYENDLTNSLKKLGPHDDLLLARAMVLDNDGEIKDFTDALSRAREQGLKLSPFQERQLQEINIPRRPPMWEIFNSEDKLFNWTPFINYIRGKR